MRHYLIILLFISSICNAQNGKPIDYHNADYYPDAQSLFEQNVPIDSILLLLANAILSTPDDNEVNKRNDILNDIMGWFLNNSEKEYLLGKKSDEKKGLELDNYTLKIGCADTVQFGDEKFFTYDGNIVVYYIVCLTKVITENRDLSDTEIKIKATEHLIEYIFNKANYTEHSILSYEKIEQNEFLQNLKSKGNIRHLIENTED